MKDVILITLIPLFVIVIYLYYTSRPHAELRSLRKSYSKFRKKTYRSLDKISSFIKCYHNEIEESVDQMQKEIDLRGDDTETMLKDVMNLLDRDYDELTNQEYKDIKEEVLYIIHHELENTNKSNLKIKRDLDVILSKLRKIHGAVVYAITKSFKY